MTMHPGDLLRRQLAGSADIQPFLGIYDCFSATIAAQYSPNLFLSGFGFAASHYGLPDIGFVAWSDLVALASRVRTILPGHILLVDIDDGYVDIHTAIHVVRQLDRLGVAMVMLEDQARPRRCGHVNGKQLLPLADYIEKLTRVLEETGSLCVLARTDASGDEIYRRIDAISKTSAEVLLVDGIDSIETLARVVAATDKPILFNQIAGGKSPRIGIDELRDLGVRLIQYSTPLLFAAQRAMQQSLDTLLSSGGILPHDFSNGDIGVSQCFALLETNLPKPAAKRSAPIPIRAVPGAQGGQAAPPSRPRLRALQG